jgi:chorismate synthase
MVAAIERAREKGESLGGSFEVVAYNVPPGLGSYVQSDRRLDSRLAAGLMGIPAIKAVEIGEGMEASRREGSSVHDQLYYSEPEGLSRRQNMAGGVEGGVSNGEPVALRAYMKPIPTLYRPLTSVNIDTWQEEKADIERSDVCAVPAASVVGEAVVSLALANELSIKLGGDSVDEVINNYRNYEGYLEKVWKWKKTSY